MGVRGPAQRTDRQAGTCWVPPGFPVLVLKAGDPGQGALNKRGRGVACQAGQCCVESQTERAHCGFYNPVKHR